MEISSGLSREAYDRFKDGLMTRRIVPGTTMTQSELSDLLAVSVSPLRNALKLLEAEGFVRVLPRSGIRIHKPDLELIKDTYQFRKILEEAAIVRFAETCSRDELLRLRDAHQAFETALQADGVDTVALFDDMSVVDRGFHEQVIASLDNPIIRAADRTNHDRIKLIRLDRHHPTALSIRKTLDEHNRVLDCLLDRDADGAREALVEHLDKAFHRAVGM